MESGWALLIAGLLITASGQALAIDYRGAIEYSLNHRNGTDIEPLTLHLVGLEFGMTTLLWRDWIGQFSADLGLTQSYTRTTTNGDSRTVTGNGRLSLFPKSRFPFQMFFDRSDSRVDSTANIRADLTSTRIGFDQKYFTDAGGRYTLKYDQHWLEQLGVGTRSRQRTDTVQRQLDLSAQRSWGAHDFRYSLLHDEIDERAQDSNSTVLLNFLSHRFSPQNGRFQLSNQFSYTDATQTTNLAPRQSDQRLRLSSTARYRGADPRQPWSLVANAFFIDRTDRNGAQTFDQRTGNLSVRGRYELSDRTTLFGDSTVFVEDRGDSDELRTIQSLGLRHRSIEHRLGAFEYDWTAGLEARNETSREQASGQTGEVSLGHSLSRRFSGSKRSRFVVRLSQRGRARESNFEASSRNISHTLGLSWSGGGSSARSFVQLRLSDDRRFGDQPQTLQTATLQSTVNRDFGRAARLSGNLSLQAIRRDDTDDNVAADTDLSSSASLRYTNSRLFGTNGLRLRSELRYLSDSFLELANERRPDEEAQSELAWRNRFDYRIGKLELGTDFDLVRQDDLLFLRIFFSLRRFFGGRGG